MEIRTHIEPGDIGYIIYLHGLLYAREYRLDHTFESFVAERIGQFGQQYDASKDYFAVAEIDDRIVGSIMIQGLPDNTGMLRFFLVHPDARGRGLGKEFMKRAVNFCREHGFERVFLWTISDWRRRSIFTSKRDSNAPSGTRTKSGARRTPKNVTTWC